MTQNKLARFLEAGIFYDPYLNVDEVIRRIQELKGKKVKILYGETYDLFGLTIDSLKYYFVINTLHNLLEKQGYEVESNILVADIASIRNDNVNKEKVLGKIKTNIGLIKKIKLVFNLKSNIILMSELFETEQFKTDFKKVTQCILESKDIKEMLSSTVITSKIKEEEEKDYLYTREEVALILGYDVKIGPPREINYDIIAQEIANKLNKNKLIGIYVKPTYPLGKNFDFFLENPQIDEFGVTPYKAGSNRLQGYRIILDKTRLEDSKKLIEKTFIPSDDSLPNPLLDLQIILDLAKRCREDNFSEFKEFELDKQNIKMIPHQVQEDIIQRLK